MQKKWESFAPFSNLPKNTALGSVKLKTKIL